MRVIVIGAGLAGLTAADALTHEGIEVTVLEATDRVGGRVWSEQFHGLGTVERGAEFVLLGESEVAGLAKRFGLELYDKGMLYANREPRGGETVTRAEVKAAFDRLAGELLSGQTVDEALRDQPGPIAAALRTRAQISNAYDPGDLDVEDIFTATGGINDLPTQTVAGGNMQIAEGLASALREPVRLRTRVKAVAHSPSGVTISTSDGQLEADGAVLAVGAGVVDDIDFSPALPAGKRSASLRFGHAAKLFVALKRPAPPSAVMSVPDAYWCFTQLTPSGEQLPILGAFAGSREAIERLEVDSGPERWVGLLQELRPDLELDPSRVLLATWHDQPTFRSIVMARTVSAPVDDDELARPVGRLAFAGEYTAGIEWHGSMEGAVRSGRRAAQDVLAFSAREPRRTDPAAAHRPPGTP
jgi:monoamine oxidase